MARHSGSTTVAGARLSGVWSSVECGGGQWAVLGADLWEEGGGRWVGSDGYASFHRSCVRACSNTVLDV